MTKRERDRTEAVERLRESLKPGDTVHVILRHVSRSGMQRILSPVKLETCEKCKGQEAPCGYCRGAGTQVLHLGYNAAVALGWRPSKDQGVYVDGCGMDMGFHLVYELSYLLFSEKGYPCQGDRCQSSEHHASKCRCGHQAYDHAVNEQGTRREGCEKCSCKQLRLATPPRGKGVTHQDAGYALKHEWL